jgi:hypothetical protein
MLSRGMEHQPATSLTRTAFDATIHCLTGCAIGEVLGLVISTALGWHDLPSILIAIVLAFGFGYGLTIGPLLNSGLPFRGAVRTALAADSVPIVVMEVMDSAVVIVVPGCDGGWPHRRPVLGQPRPLACHRISRRLAGQSVADRSRPRTRRRPRSPVEPQ